jgi:TetR/AcrR family transcriptional regulator, transcriptional repressor for nem operon
MTMTVTPTKFDTQQVPTDTPLNFAQRLELRAAAPGKRKGARTRDGLKAAAAKLLGTIGYRDLRVSDINEEAGVSNALFYVYFKNKQEITQEVLTEFIETLVPETPGNAPHPATTVEAIYLGNLGYTRVFAANPGLMRCLIQFGDEIPEFGKLWSDWNDRWHDRTLRAIKRRDSASIASADDVFASVCALGMMVDGMLRLLYVERNARALKAANEVGDTPDAIAIFLTRLWYRALFGSEMMWQPSPESAG